MGRNESQVKNRVGEMNVNSFGSKMIIVNYNNALDLEVYFPQYDWYTRKTYNNFKKGGIVCPYEPRYFNHGYLGEGEYKMSIQGKHSKAYNSWHAMLQRCYDPKYHEKFPTYKDCSVEDYLLNFQHFNEWYDENYYEIPNEKMCLDKDILLKGNKVYSRETCIYVPERINALLIKSDSTRGNYPIGVSYDRERDCYRAECNNGKSHIFIGYYQNQHDAFVSYKKFKEKLIKETAIKYKKSIPTKLFNALYNYEVDIND